MELNTPKDLTLGQRLAADTPTFFKKVDFIGLALMAIGGGLTGIVGLPAFIVPALLGIGTTLTVISKFAVKDTSVLANPNATIQDYTAVLVELPKQLAEIKEGIANTVQTINTGQIKPSMPVLDTPIVEVPPVVIPAPQPGIEQFMAVPEQPVITSPAE